MICFKSFEIKWLRRRAKKTTMQELPVEVNRWTCFKMASGLKRLLLTFIYHLGFQGCIWVRMLFLLMFLVFRILFFVFTFDTHCLRLLMKMIEQILYKLEFCEDRNNARLVCSVWRDILNRKCDKDAFKVGNNMNKLLPTSMPTDLTLRSFLKGLFQISMSNTDLCETLLKCERRDICYDFRDAQLERLESFWTQGWSRITSLRLSMNDSFVATYNGIREYCKCLKTLSLENVTCVRTNDPDTVVNSTFVDVIECQLPWPSVKDVTLHVRTDYDVHDSIILENTLRKLPFLFPNVDQVEIVYEKNSGEDKFRFLGAMWYPLRESLLQLKYRLKIRDDLQHQEIRVDNKEVAAVGGVPHVPFWFNGKVVVIEMGVFDDNFAPFMFMMSSEQELADFFKYAVKMERFIMILSESVQNLKPIKHLHFPPRARDDNEYRTWGKNLNFVDIKFPMITFNHNCPAVFENLLHLSIIARHIYGFDEAFMGQLKNLQILHMGCLTYQIYLDICQFLPQIEYLKIIRCIDFDESLFEEKSQKNLLKFKKLIVCCIPEDILKTEISNSEHNWTRYNNFEDEIYINM